MRRAAYSLLTVVRWLLLALLAVGLFFLPSPCLADPSFTAYSFAAWLALGLIQALWHRYDPRLSLPPPAPGLPLSGRVVYARLTVVRYALLLLSAPVVYALLTSTAPARIGLLVIPLAWLALSLVQEIWWQWRTEIARKDSFSRREVSDA